jgi:teichuronic acid biosynthesis glycosyltransferase TuaC
MTKGEGSTVTHCGYQLIYDVHYNTPIESNFSARVKGLMRILVITSVFPNSKQPNLGVFVRERMFRVAKHCELKVIAPVPWFPFINRIKKDYRPKVPYIEVQDGVEVYHPRFFNIPRFFKFMDGFFFFLTSIFTVWEVRRSFNFDIIDSHFAYPDGFGSVLFGRVFRRPITLTIRGTIRKLTEYSLIRAQIKYALKSAAKVFTVSNDLKKAVAEFGIPEEKVVVIPNGVDIEKFRPMEKIKARKELGLPIDKKIIISVGGLVERKGFHRVISVIPEIKKRLPDVIYMVVGGPSVEGNYEPVLRQMVKELGLEKDVLFAGPQPHEKLHRWLSASDIFCLATSNEGWANVFLEAMACGLPVVTTRVGGNEEVVVSEDYGLLFNIGDKQAMIDTILKALRKNWNREIIVRYAKSNSWEDRVRNLIDHFKLMTNSNKPILSPKIVIQ